MEAVTSVDNCTQRTLSAFLSEIAGVDEAKTSPSEALAPAWLAIFRYFPRKKN